MEGGGELQSLANRYEGTAIHVTPRAYEGRRVAVHRHRRGAFVCLQHSYRPVSIYWLSSLVNVSSSTCSSLISRAGRMANSDRNPVIMKRF